MILDPLRRRKLGGGVGMSTARLCHVVPDCTRHVAATGCGGGVTTTSQCLNLG